MCPCHGLFLLCLGFLTGVGTNETFPLTVHMSHSFFPGFSDRYEHAALRCDRTDDEQRRGEGTEADQRGCFEFTSSPQLNGCVGRLNFFFILLLQF